MILIVDDNPSNIYSLKKLLESNDFPVDSANGGEEALSKALQNSYALIILDVQMPDMDGFEVAETLSGYSKTKNIPIIFLSAANTEKSFITKGYASGGIDYVTKPVDSDILLLKVKTYYTMQELNQKLKQSRKSLELEIQGRRKTQVMMKSKLDHLQQLLEALPQIAFTMKSNGELDYVNRKWYDYSDSEVLFPSVHEEDETIETIFNSRKHLNSVIDLETRIQNLESREFRYHLLKIVPIFENDLLKSWVGTFTDINDQKRVEKEKDEFLSIASHELKTPLTSIKAYVQLLERKLKLAKASAESGYLTKVQDQVEKLNILITDLLDVSKIENGKMKMNLQFQSLESVVDSAIETILQTHEERTVEIEREGDVINFPVCFDSIRVEQVLINFLTNAIKYSPKNNKVIVSTTKDEQQVTVSVTDFGIGIPKYKQDAVFQKFYRVEESSLEFQGLGIGLYICAEIIEQHGGTIGLESNLDQGSSFYFTLPINTKTHG